MMDQWPLVGREHEVRQIQQFLTGRVSGVVLAGAGGVGKTRLAEECSVWAERNGFAVLRVSGTQTACSLPLGSFSAFVPGDPTVERGATDSRADLLRRVAANLTGQASRRGLVLQVDDAHLLDDASGALVLALAQAGSCFLLVTLRAGSPAPEAIQALWKEGLAERLEIKGLASQELRTALASALGGPVAGATEAAFVVRSQGNMLFLRELVLGALAEGALQREGDVWRLVAPLAPSDRLTELIEARLANLSPPERSLLELVAFGESVSRAVLETLGDFSVAVDLERRGFLRVTVSGRRTEVTLPHPLYGDVIRRGIPILQAGVIAGRLAELVEQAGARRREDVLRVGTWRLASGGARPEVMSAAAFAARWRYDLPLAERLARAASTAGAGFETKLLVAQLACLQGRGDEGEAELAALAEAAGGDEERAMVAVSRIDNAGFYLGRLDEAEKLAAEAEATIVEPGWRNAVLARRSGIVLSAAGPRAAAAIAEPLLQTGSGGALVWAALVAGHSLARLGRFDAALGATDVGRVAHDQLTGRFEWHRSMHDYMACYALGQAGRLGDAEALARSRYEEALTIGSSEQQALFGFALAGLVDSQGHVVTAIRFGQEAVALFTELGRPRFAVECLPVLALAYCLRGRADQARALLMQIDRNPGDIAGSAAQVELLEARGWLAVAEGNLPAARARLTEAADLGETRGDLVRATAALHGLARLGEPGPILRRLERLAAVVEGDLALARAAHARGLAAHDGASLEAVVGTFSEMGADVLAAEAASDAAVAWRKAGRLALSEAAGQRARELTGRCEGAVTPALTRPASRTLLTPAEQQVARLAVAGQSNQAIADLLHLSIRTVQNHLHHVYGKLGVGGRAELRAAMGEHPGPE